VLKQLSKAEATVFAGVSKHVLTSSPDTSILIKSRLNAEAFGIATSDIMLCTELGLIQPNNNHVLASEADERSGPLIDLHYGSKSINLEPQNGESIIGLPAFFLTVPGADLATLIPKDDEEYFLRVVSYFEKDYKTSVIH